MCGFSGAALPVATGTERMDTRCGGGIGGGAGGGGGGPIGIAGIDGTYGAAGSSVIQSALPWRLTGLACLDEYGVVLDME